ncbi:outer membrane beta-barrel protein [Minwuia thermotolerans]|uniref:Alginate export domain-containing protein n=1 Tax=Minwuia thermotolerans TaxID=2056226 RepID=A0A2M9FZZ0_9PROT|nr:outer membrane beta-barrel protein [Minwuia thermotolerans]PJK29030.1 hypothetical protein CVT23_14005 [Minwuia thermotolerans]
MMRRAWQIGFGFCLCAVVALPGMAVAQGAADGKSEKQVKPQIVQNPIIPGQVDPEPPFTTAKQDAVLNRRRPEYEPIGMLAGGILRDVKYLGRGQILESFLLFPSIETEVAFDSNIFAEANDKTADFIGTVRPELELHSDWDNHEFFVRGFGEFARYASNSRESFARYGAELGTRLDVTEFLFLKFGAGWQRKTAARSDIETDTGGDEPTVFHEAFASGQARYKRDKFLVDANTSITARDFRDNTAAGVTVDNDQNDNWIWENSLRLGWEEWRGTTIFLEPFFNLARNFRQFDNAGLERGFYSTGVNVGFTYDASAVTFLEGALGIGYGIPHDRNADSFPFLSGKLDLVWNPHDSWTFTAGWNRRLAQTNAFSIINNVNVPDVAALTDTLSLGAQLEVTYEILASAGIDLALADTLENGTSDTGVDTELALLWLMNEYMRMRGFWNYSLLSSNDANREFSKHVVGVTLTMHY